MPLKSLEGRLRAPVELVIRTGIKRKSGRTGGEYPAEVDYFVFPWNQPEERQKEHAEKAEQRIDPRTYAEVQQLYAGKPKRLRMMLYAEWDMADGTGREIAVAMSNEAWGAGGLKCTGNGEDRENPGIASTRDGEWAQRIANTTHVKPLPLPRGWQQIQCRGIDCPKHLVPEGGSAIGHDEDACCKPVMRLRAMLLHPTTDAALPDGTRNPDYLRPLCFVQITSGSWNAMLNLRGRFQVLRALAGRSSFVPFELTRPAQETKHGGRTQIHWPLNITWSVEEIQRVGIVHPTQLLLPPEIREEAARLAAAAPAPDYEAVRDLYPYAIQERVEATVPRLPAPTLQPPGGGAATPPPLADPDRDAVLMEAEGDAELTQAERDSLKALVGLGDSDDRAARVAKLNRFAAVAREVMAALGEESPGDNTEVLKALRKRHEEPLRERLQAEEQEAQADPAAALGW